MQRTQLGIGKIVFVSLLCMSLGTLAIGFTAIFGVQSYGQEFDRLVEVDLPQADASIRLNGAISGLTSQVGALALVHSTSALGTVRIQIDDQLEAIGRLRDQVQDVGLLSANFAKIDDRLTQLTSNLRSLMDLIAQRIDSETEYQELVLQARQAEVAADLQRPFLLLLNDLEDARNPIIVTRIERAFEAMYETGLPPATRAMIPILLTKRRDLASVERLIQGGLNHHAQLASLLTDSTQLMSSILNKSTTERSALIQEKMRLNAYLILICFMVFASIAVAIFFYLDKNVVGRIQQLTRQINAYIGKSGAAQNDAQWNEITTIEVSFDTLRDTIDEREERLVALNVTATEARSEAEQANRSKSKLLAAASHDLRQPIHAMGLLLGGIDRTKVDAETAGTIENVATLTRETGQMFNSILDLSKLETGTFTAIKVPVDVGELFDRLRSEFPTRAASENVDLSVTNQLSNEMVLGDSEAIYRILSNLIINAIEYGDKGIVAVECFLKNGTAVFQVSDDGPGLATISNTASNADIPHYGLGLSICFALANAMGSKLNYHSPEKGGTTFNFSVPLAEQPKLSSRPTVEPPRRSLSGRNIVLLEDNATVSSITQNQLEALGGNVTAAKSVNEAKRIMADHETPFLFITDFDLGRGNTTSNFVTELLSENQQMQGVIVATASPARLPSDWKTNPRIHVMEKPFMINRLASLVRFIC